MRALRRRIRALEGVRSEAALSPASLLRRGLAYAIDQVLSLIFTFGWAAGLLLFIFLLDLLFDLGLIGLLRYGRHPALTGGLFASFFAVPYLGYFTFSLMKTGKTPGKFFMHLRVIPHADPKAKAPSSIPRLQLWQGMAVSLPPILAGLAVLAHIPSLTDPPRSEWAFELVRLPAALAWGLLGLSQVIDWARRAPGGWGLHERLARVRVVRDLPVKELVERERRLTEAHIAGGMAHEIRNALGSAKLQLDRLNERAILEKESAALTTLLSALTQEARLDRQGQREALEGLRTLYEDRKVLARTLEEVTASIDRGLAITRRVMDFSKLRPKGGEEPREVVDLNRLVKNLGAGYQESFAEGGISLVLDLKADVPIQGNGGQCYSLLQNLLLNARDAILAKRDQGVPQGSADPAPGERGGALQSMGAAQKPSSPLGAIRIATSSGNGEVVLSVCDDGIGIPPEHMERIFEPFFSTKPSQGMGLGLNECRRIVELHGGEIEVASEAGQGTTLTVRWPASPEGVT